MDNVHNGFVYYVVSCCSWEIYFKKFCKGVQGKKLFQKFFPCIKKFSRFTGNSLAAAAIAAILANVTTFLESHFRAAFRAGRIL